MGEEGGKEETPSNEMITDGGKALQCLPHKVNPT